MLVLGLETSCDETAAAVLKDGDTLLSNIINDQIGVHSPYGGIVPELAGRSHNERVHRVIKEAVAEAGVRLRDIDLIAVTVGPGLFHCLAISEFCCMVYRQISFGTTMCNKQMNSNKIELHRFVLHLYFSYYARL